MGGIDDHGRKRIKKQYEPKLPVDIQPPSKKQHKAITGWTWPHAPARPFSAVREERG